MKLMKSQKFGNRRGPACALAQTLQFHFSTFAAYVVIFLNLFEVHQFVPFPTFLQFPQFFVSKCFQCFQDVFPFSSITPIPPISIISTTSMFFFTISLVSAKFFGSPDFQNVSPAEKNYFTERVFNFAKQKRSLGPSNVALRASQSSVYRALTERVIICQCHHLPKWRTYHVRDDTLPPFDRPRTTEKGGIPTIQGPTCSAVLDPREAPKACHWFLLECRSAGTASKELCFHALVPRTTQKEVAWFLHDLSGYASQLLSRVRYVWSAGLMRSTRWVTPEASGTGSEQASSRTVHTLPAGMQRSQCRENLHSKPYEGLRE